MVMVMETVSVLNMCIDKSGLGLWYRHDAGASENAGPRRPVGARASDAEGATHSRLSRGVPTPSLSTAAPSDRPDGWDVCTSHIFGDNAPPNRVCSGSDLRWVTAA